MQSRRVESPASKGKLAGSLKLKELSAARYVLGMQISQHVRLRKTTMKQSQYIADIAAWFGHTAAKPVYNPCRISMKIIGTDAPQTASERADMRTRPYRSLIGCLLYVATRTRPDMTYAVGNLSQYVENPGRADWVAVVHVLQYLHTTPDYGFVFNGGTTSGIRLKAWCEADWASIRTIADQSPALSCMWLAERLCTRRERKPALRLAPAKQSSWRQA